MPLFLSLRLHLKPCDVPWSKAKRLLQSKAFVAGSSKDVATNSGANAAFAGLAFAVAALAIGGGSFFAKDKAPGEKPIVRRTPLHSLIDIMLRTHSGMQFRLSPTRSPLLLRL